MNYLQHIDYGTVIAEKEFQAIWLIRDLNDRADRIKHLEFHIDHGDYFAVLATIINIALKEPDFEKTKIFAKLYEDLQYLQENYTIVKKNK